MFADRRGEAVMVGLDRKKIERSANRRMKSLTASWLSILLTITFTCLQQKASAQAGFLSLDCGVAAPYVDGKGISWKPDDAYISGGKKAAVVTMTSDPQLKNLRYFPDTTRTRYCYSLPTSIGQNYLLRAIFFHGNYDNSAKLKFEAAADLFATKEALSFTPQDGYNEREYIFRGFKDNIEFCLFRMAPTDNPFISSLELRPLDNTMYATVAGGSALSSQYRVNCGPSRADAVEIRYPDDPYDRVWYSAPVDPDFHKTITASSVQANIGFAVDKPPPAVMNTALTIQPYSGSHLGWVLSQFYAHNNVFLVNLFLAELEDSSARTRTFDILLNGVVWVADVNVYTNALNSLYKPIEFSTDSANLFANGTMDILFLRRGSSFSPPPIMNAMEVFSVHERRPGTLPSDVSAIEGLKKAFGLGAAWTGDPCLILPYDWLTCTIDSSPRVSAVNLSSAGLVGRIPDLRALTSLTTLHLDNNKLTGPIPGWLASLPNLKELYLQNNDLSGIVPKGLLSLPDVRLEGNPGLCWNTTCSEDKKTGNVMIIVGVVVGVLVAVGIVIAVVVVCCCRRAANKVEKEKDPPVSELELEDGKSEGTSARERSSAWEGTASRGSRYTLAQVMAATKNNAKMLGRGGFGPVYYGELASGQEVAVKVSAKGSNQGSKEFINEIELLTRVHHKNLVSLVGYCDEGNNLILLYEYMPKGTVQDHLYGVGEQKKDFVLDWKTRLQIALNSAQGLEYLHVGCNPVIFHRDVKSNNILLNEKLTAKVADFGLSKSTTDTNDNVTHMSTMVKGTIGYLDPEYFSTNQLTDKSDVYGFGIVLLELICARPPLVPQLPEDQRRVDQWVRPYLQAGTIEEIVDPALAGQYNLDAMWKVADLAMMSVEPKGKHRPNMSTIVQELRAARDIENNSSSFIRPPSQDSSSSAFRFDIPQSSSSVSDPQIGANTTVQAR